jgi:uncharacterized protein YceH (UPF0502 family)
MATEEARRLDPLEARILGVLIEKELTTPEQYPLSVNALTAGCNQKSNRDPVLDLSESEVHAATGKMIVKGWAGAVHPSGSRVERFRHNAGEMLGLGRAQLAVLAELLMRGPQQPGELRARASRMAEMPTQAALTDVLAPMLERGLVARRDPEPGSRAESYAQTLAPAAHPAPARPAATGATIVAASMASPAPAERADSAVDLAPIEKRMTELQNDLAQLRRQLSNLAWKLGEKLDPP